MSWDLHCNALSQKFWSAVKQHCTALVHYRRSSGEAWPALCTGAVHYRGSDGQAEEAALLCTALVHYRWWTALLQYRWWGLTGCWHPICAAPWVNINPSLPQLHHHHLPPLSSWFSSLSSSYCFIELLDATLNFIVSFISVLYFVCCTFTSAPLHFALSP